MTLRALEEAYSRLSQAANDLARAGRHAEVGIYLRQRRQVQLWIDREHARRSVLEAIKAADYDGLCSALSELEAVEDELLEAGQAGCTAPSFEAAASPLAGIRQPL